MLGTDYPFPLGELAPGKLIASMPYDDSIKESMFSDSALNWLKLDRNVFTL
jgi:aminocarboxymuconate-semialdehyde decarboxylase